MSMINSVRETVLSLLNKNNYGYITPNDFNLYAKQAQLDIFEDYFYQYNYQINQENKRQSGTGLADITKGYEEVIDSFSQIKALSHSALNLVGVELPHSNIVLCTIQFLLSRIIRQSWRRLLLLAEKW